MPQTLLAFSAMMLATIFAINQHKATLNANARMVRNEVATQAVSVAEEVLDHIEYQEFDANVSLYSGGITSADQLTDEGQFPIGTDYENAVSVEEFNHMTPYVLARPGPADSLHFQIEAEVRYVRLDNPSVHAASPTFLKEVTIEVTAPTLPGFYMPAPIRKVRIVSYQN